VTLHPNQPGRIAAVDFGTKRIGVAVTDPSQTIASPLCVYQRGDAEADARYFARLAKLEDVTLWVVGLPVHTSGAESEKSREARQFAVWLHATTGVPIDLFDERFTTAAADALLGEAELTSRQRKKRRDMLAAQILLTAYLESSSRGRQPPGPLDDEP